MLNTKRKPGFNFLVLFGLLFLGFLCTRSNVNAQGAEAGVENEEVDGLENLWGEIRDGFDYTLRALAYGAYQDIAGSTNNPNNDFYRLPTSLVTGEIRPDLSLTWRRLELSARPRMTLQHQKWEKGNREGETDWDDDWFLNEWLARLVLRENLFVSYGRENLQWGPSYLLSPSNPFFRDNGRDNPIAEVAGMDFARLVWLPSENWTVSFIANTSKGHQKNRFRDFEETYAFKLDYTGREAYASMILSHRQSDRNRLGAFAGWTATDALLLYGEGVVSRGSNALYPVKAGNPFAYLMEARDRDDASLIGTVLIGGAYTFLWGPTLTLEYVYNGPGYTDEEAEVYYVLRENASNELTSQGPLSGFAKWTLSQTADPGLRLLRQHVAMLQYTQTGIGEVLDLTCRWTQSIDDGSGQFLSIAEYYWGDHVKLFSIGTINSGGGSKSFGDVFDLQWMVGLEYTL